MEILCPYCRHPKQVKGAKPGRYNPKCGQCGKAFLVSVPDDPTRAMSVSVMPGKPASGSSKAVPNKVTPATPAAVKPKPKAPPKPPEEIDITAALDPNAPAPPQLDPTMAEVPPPPRPSKSASKKAKTAIDLPHRLGGYEIIKELGRGGMGAVFLARQVSLDRKVALKVMSPQFASNPVFMARFTREAYAAAQLVHHNIVQVYDIGEDRGISYFSMEFVEGQTLGEMIKKSGKLDPLTATAYTIQAARGLKFGHDRGMIHRDIKPDNLMVNDQGVVKVADLGLVKTPEMTPEDDAPVASNKPKSIAQTASSQVTAAGAAMGTPAYMSPEQARDAAGVDRRADIYSLGCTFYVMLTGKPPFVGNTVLEVLSQHASKPVIPPDTVVKNVPKELSEILLKMVAKKPDDRYADMAEVIDALQRFEASQGRGKAALGDAEAESVAQAGRDFNAVPAARMRTWIPLGFFGGSALLFLVTLCAGWWLVAGAFLALTLLTPVFYAVLTGVMERTHLWGKARELAGDLTFREWLMLVGGGLLVAVIILVAQLWGFVGAAVFALGFAFAFYFLFDRRLGGQRKPALDKVGAMLRSLRLKGVDEDELREFVCKYAGEHWEEMYEALFGYEAKLEARQHWGKNDRGQQRPKYAAWRDAVYQWIEARMKARREARAKKHLQAVERKNLEAQGVAAQEAKDRAEAVAEVMVQKAAEFREVSKKAAEAEHDEPTMASPPLPELVDVRKLLEIPDQPDGLPRRRRSWGLGGMFVWLFSLLFGGPMRFVVGALLLTACVLWVSQQDGVPTQDFANLDPATDIEAAGQQGWNALEKTFHVVTGQKVKPLSLPVVGQLPADLFNSLNVGAAGLILLLSAFFRGWKMALIMWPAAAVTFLGHTFGVIPEMGPIQPQYVTMIAGGGLAVVGFLLGRETR